jgi:hypothetical protein
LDKSQDQNAPGVRLRQKEPDAKDEFGGALELKGAPGPPNDVPRGRERRNGAQTEGYKTTRFPAIQNKDQGNHTHAKDELLVKIKRNDEN